MSTDLHKKRHEFILRNASKNITQIAQGFFQEFNLSTKHKALDALHTSLHRAGYTQLMSQLKEDEFKEWAANYFSQGKGRKKMSVEMVVDKKRKRLQIAGVVQGSRFIESGIGLLSQEEDRIAASSLRNRPPFTPTSSSSASLPPSTFTTFQQDEEHTFRVAKNVHDKYATTPLAPTSSNIRPFRSSNFTSPLSSVETTKNPPTEQSPTEPDTDVDISEAQIVYSRAMSTPFYDLIAYVFQKVKKKPATLPSLIPQGLSKNHKELYKAALCELRKPGLVQAKKDVLVMLSGIINTVAPSGRSFTVSKSIMTSSQLPPVDPASDTHRSVKEVLKRLLDALCPTLEQDPYAEPQFVQLQKTIWKELCRAVDLKQTESGMAMYTTLLIVQHVVASIEQGSLAPPTSEHVFVSVWTWILNILFVGTRLRVIPGELISKSSADARQATESEFGSTKSTVSGRKVDMSLRIQVDNEWRSEIAVFEFKTASASQHTCNVKQKKSVRLNAAILVDLEDRGLDVTRHYPVIAEGRGLSLNFYTLRRYGDVLGAGRATAQGITLPSDVSSLKNFFLSDSILTLFAFKEHLRRFSIDVTDALAQSKATPLDDDVDYSYFEEEQTSMSSATPPRKRSKPIILFSPASKDKRNNVPRRSLTETDETDEQDEYELEHEGYDSTY
ncbi:hypothetical protein EMPS_10832 [Entomortierella parvispora]|uniref:Uncharacterized protein n=1 Tax=Entomortierella parvispora TaxID=205924 RepID=A0A9P3M1N2_9FUNG|nr:hypothetical protein EMPS_10832 [Entomortierella parvispora]